MDRLESYSAQKPCKLPILEPFITKTASEWYLAVFEFQGTLHRNRREMHDAIAEEWLNAGELGACKELQRFSHSDANLLTEDAMNGFGLHEVPGADRQELAEAFVRLISRFAAIVQGDGGLRETSPWQRAAA